MEGPLQEDSRYAGPQRVSELFDAETGEIKPPSDSVLVAFAIYQQEAARQEWWVKHRTLIKPWRASIKERMEEHDGIASWREAITIASKSPFLCGKITVAGRPRFKLDMNFLVQPRSFAKILDGFYTREPEPPARIHIPTGYQPPHLKAATPFVAEPLEVKLANSIVSARNLKMYAKANKFEEQLAALQGRAPVLVPAPDVARLGFPDRPAEIPKRPSRPVTDLVDEYADIPEAPNYGGE